MDKKYYVKTGEFEVITSAPDGLSACVKVLEQIFEKSWKELQESAGSMVAGMPPDKPIDELLKADASFRKLLVRCGAFVMASERGFDPDSAEGMTSVGDLIKYILIQRLLAGQFKKEDSDGPQ